MSIHKFIKKSSSLNSPVGDLANDILRDQEFPKEKSDYEILDYLENKTLQNGIHHVFLDFLEEYRVKSNETLRLILRYLKDENIESIEKLLQSGITEKFPGLCEYRTTIPLGSNILQNLTKDVNELRTMNENVVEISNGEALRSHLVDLIHTDGKNIIFCSQKIQLRHLISMSKNYSL